MSSHEPISRQYDIHTSMLINSVRDEEFRDNILENVFKRSSMENPYLRNVKCSTDLCIELKENQRKKFVEEKRRQQRRQTNEELKTLEQQIRAGYVMRTVQAQIYEKEALAKDFKTREEAESNRILEAKIKLQDGIDAENSRAKKEDLRKELIEQISHKKALHRKKYQKLLEERRIMDEAVKKYKEELEKEKLAEREKKIKTKKGMDEHMQAKHELAAAQGEAWEEEEKKFKKIMMMREEEQKKAKEEKRKRALQKDLLSQEIGKQIHAIAEEKARNRDLLAELLCDEREAKDNILMKENLQKQQYNKMLSMREMERKHLEKEQEKLAQKKRDDAYFQEEMRILAERDKLEQLSDQKRRKKQMEHRKALQDALTNQKLRRAEQAKLMIREREELVNNEKRRERCIQEERIQMLKEHADILKYCAPRMVRDSEKKLLNV